MARRSKAREVALQMLFQRDFNPDADARVLKNMIGERLEDEEMFLFCWQLVSGVLEHREELDQQISAVAENWSVDRMASTDRNAIRIGVYEMTFLDTPPPVAINEAIELSRKFGAKESTQFVNGIMDRLNKSRDEAAAE
ncbi:MAG: transcription antitermination factor NusB [Planctomycetaceae bacterium]|nr:transcription antitermination factor NusB [Planctomycetaceae bacterium]